MKVGVMSDTSNRRNFKYTLSPQRVEFALDSLLTKILPTKNVRFKHSSVPVLISVNVNYKDRPCEIFPIRIFLKRLRALQEKFFVRFVTDILWAAESDSVDIFYTFDGNTKDYCDIYWDISILENGYIELTSRSPRSTTNHSFIYDTARQVSKYAREVSFPSFPDRSMVYDFLADFYGKIHEVRDIREIDSHFHILMVVDTPREGNTTYYPLPIIGMNHQDAKRVYRESFKNVLELYVQHEDTLQDPIDITQDDIMSNLISMIIENQRSKDRKTLTANTYRLTEMLLGYYISTVEDYRYLSTHDIIIFQSLIPSTGSFDTFSVSMDDISV
jgi:hypothetical protein